MQFSRGDTGRAEYALAMAAQLIDDGRFAFPVAATFALTDLADAHRASESGTVRGKLVLLIGQPHTAT